MTSVLSGQLLAADPGTRQLTYRLLTYGEEGLTSLGRVKVRAGAVTVPPGDVTGNLEHDYTRPLARASAVADDGRTLEATFTVAPTHAGDDLLAEAAAGLRTGASVELGDVRVHAGWVEAGTLTGVGFVVRPAFPSSQLVAGEHPDVDPTRPEDPPVTTEDTTPELTPAGDGASTPPAPAGPPALTPAPAVVPAAYFTASRPPLTVAAVSQLVAAVRNGTRDAAELKAALVDIIPVNDAGQGFMRPSWIGELWTATNADRPVVDSISSQALPGTGMKVQGFKWGTKPTGATYAGDKAAVPSTAATTVAAEAALIRWAGANDIDRIFFDRGDASFQESYFRMLAMDYALDTEAAVTAALVAQASAGDVAATTVLKALADAAGKLAAIGAKLTFMAIASNLYPSLLAITNANAPWLLSGSAGITDSTAVLGGVRIFVAPGLAGSTALAGDKRAATFYEDRPPIG